MINPPLPNPTPEILRCEQAIVSHRNFKFSVENYGSDPSETVAWISRPGRIVTYTTWQPNALRRNTTWHLGLFGSRLTGIDTTRNWTFQMIASSRIEKLKMLKQFEKSIPESVSMILSPHQMATFFHPFEVASKLWIRKENSKTVTWDLKKGTFGFHMTFEKGTGLILDIGAHSKSPYLNYDWHYSYPIYDPIPSVIEPNGAVRTGGFSLAKPLPVYKDPKVNQLISKIFAKYQFSGKLKVKIDSSGRSASVWRDGAKVWYEKSNGDGFWWTGTKVYVHGRGKFGAKTLTLGQLQAYLMPFGITLDSLTRAFLGGHNFAGRIFLPAIASDQGSILIGRIQYDLISLKFPDQIVKMEIDNSSHFIAMIDREEMGQSGAFASLVTHYRYEAWTHPPKF